METALTRNLKRNLKPLQARSDQIAALGEDARDRLLSRVEEYILRLREGDPAAASEAEQQLKIARTQSRAAYWLNRQAWSAKTLLERPI